MHRFVNLRYPSLAFLGLLYLPCFLSTFPTVANAGAPIHGAKAGGMGTAFVAVADDPSAILHNPAGLTRVQGNQVYTGMSGVIIDSEYRGSAASNGTEFQVFPVPHLFASIWASASGIDYNKPTLGYPIAPGRNSLPPPVDP